MAHSLSQQELAVIIPFSGWVYVEYSLAGFGGLIVLSLAFSLITHSYIDTGTFGLFGFPVIGMVYGYIRGNRRKAEVEHARHEIERLSTKTASLQAEYSAKDSDPL